VNKEIEAKLKVDSFVLVEEKLAQLGAEFLGQLSQRDDYFDNADLQMVKADKALRVRREKSDQSEKVFLTYKGAREKGQFKSRREIEVEVGDADLTTKLLCELGYETVIVVEKKRRIWKLADCEIALDELERLGCFVEIEGPSEQKIADVQKGLGLSDQPHIRESYACLIAQKSK
jgi:adenylate cyclase class 2